MPALSETVFAWVRVLDQLTYYELFGLQPGASDDEIRAAFHVFCDTFHPDRHLSRSPEERAALARIFKRGTEAHLVLTDYGLRLRYDASLGSGGEAPPSRVGLSGRSHPPSMPPAAPTLEDSVRSPAARPFVRRAQELIRAGDFRQAKLQLVMANHMDPDNPALEAALKNVEAKLTKSIRPPPA
jgi:curved DNA-binding protein CbpA